MPLLVGLTQRAGSRWRRPHERAHAGAGPTSGLTLAPAPLCQVSADLVDAGGRQARKKHGPSQLVSFSARCAAPEGSEPCLRTKPSTHEKQ